MAKKKAASDFNMTEEIRKLLRAKRTLMGREVYDTLVKNFPNQRINKASCLVGFSKTRQQLGISKGLKKKVVKKRVVERKTVSEKRSAATSTSVDIATLQAAAKFVSEIGNADRAIVAIRQLQSVQIG